MPPTLPWREMPKLHIVTAFISSRSGPQLTYLRTYLLSHSRGTPLSHLHCPVGQLRSRVVGPEYVGQGAEGLSREAKLQWAARGGHEVQNLQHDGVMVRLDGGLATREAERQLTSRGRSMLAAALA